MKKQVGQRKTVHCALYAAVNVRGAGVGKLKKCAVRGCKNTFKPINNFHRVCSMGCAIKYDKANGVKKDREKKRKWNVEKKKRRESLMTLGDWKKRAQAVFNAYIRERDKHLPCVSCGASSGKMNAGHYLSVGASPELRFNEDNVHKQCERCNSYLSGNLINYRKNLTKRIGAERVEYLEGPHEMPRWRVEDIKEIIAIYKKNEPTKRRRYVK